MKIKQLTSYPIPNELGMGNTHETYIRVENSLDVSDIFPIDTEVSIFDSCDKSKSYQVKAKSGTEFRINQLGGLYRDYKVLPGDEIKFTYIERDDEKSIFFTVKNKNGVFLTVTTKGTEIFNVERLYPYMVKSAATKEYEIQISEGILTLKFSKSEKKRSDSPTNTDFYESLVNGEKISNGCYYISLEEKNTLNEVKKNFVDEFNLPDSTTSKKSSKILLRLPLQQIFYGAPGTGKSHTINEQTKGESVIRTTFHPDSDYSTFVGAYKPTTKSVELRDVSGHKIIEEGKEVKEDRIVYEFVAQAFLQAYILAWKSYSQPTDEGVVKPQYLVIEEINRGNCAQIFGDIFQLLDRDDNGFSKYEITSDADLQKYIAEQNLAVSGVCDSHGKDISDKINSGELLKLPNNFYIWATMNTSDQSLFPIDSAFKRRWDWKYVPIDTNKENWTIKTATNEYSWSSFLQKINYEIYETTHSEDKMLGFYFCKADDNVVDADKFVNKVLFYIYNDVFKDYGFDRDMFKGEDGKPMSFHSYYNLDGSINENLVEKFLDNLIKEENSTIPSEENVEQ